MNITDDQLITIFHIVFSKTHSNGFKKAEVKDLLFDPEYFFIETPNENWYPILIQYLYQIGFNHSELNINKQLIP